MSSNPHSKVSKLKAVGIDLEHVIIRQHMWLELLASAGSTFLQGEYYHTNIKRKLGYAKANKLKLVAHYDYSDLNYKSLKGGRVLAIFRQVLTIT